MPPFPPGTPMSYISSPISAVFMKHTCVKIQYLGNSDRFFVPVRLVSKQNIYCPNIQRCSNFGTLVQYAHPEDAPSLLGLKYMSGCLTEEQWRRLSGKVPAMKIAIKAIAPLLQVTTHQKTSFPGVSNLLGYRFLVQFIALIRQLTATPTPRIYHFT